MCSEVDVILLCMVEDPARFYPDPACVKIESGSELREEKPDPILEKQPGSTLPNFDLVKFTFYFYTSIELKYNIINTIR